MFKDDYIHLSDWITFDLGFKLNTEKNVFREIRRRLAKANRCGLLCQLKCRVISKNIMLFLYKIFSFKLNFEHKILIKLLNKNYT